MNHERNTVVRKSGVKVCLGMETAAAIGFKYATCRWELGVFSRVAGVGKTFRFVQYLQDQWRSRQKKERSAS